MAKTVKKSIDPLQAPRGTRDLIGDEKTKNDIIIEVARRISQTHRFQDIETPLFESTNVFHRLGESSDIITKETYTFEDRGENSLTLRPEGTAPVARAFISNGLTQDLPAKFFYAGPMFRYERPQKGRYRQFTQIGVELIGRDTYHADVEVLVMAKTLLDKIGIGDSVTLNINTLGDQASRDAYRHALVEYFTPHKARLSEDSQRRLEQNPLRILDSKDEVDRALIKTAPVFSAYLTDESKLFFINVCRALEALKLPFTINEALVRGLDYYCHTVFEFVSTDLGAQGTVLAGGRYDGLIQSLGGPDVSGVGWAAGLERLAMLSPLAVSKPDLVCLLPLCEEAEIEMMKLSISLREMGLSCETIYSGNIGKRLKRADKLKAHFAIFMGEDEQSQGVVQIKNLRTSASQTVAIDDLKEFFQKESNTPNQGSKDLPDRENTRKKDNPIQGHA